MNSPRFKLGRKPSPPDSRDLQFANYRTTALPALPASWGYDNIIAPNGWGMLGNDSVGDCVWAGAAHEHMLETIVTGKPATFTAEGVLSDYSACTGFDPQDPSTDQGTDPRTAMKYRQKTGIIDAAGKRHKIAAYLALDPHNLTQLEEACYLFGSVGLCWNLPESAQTEFQADKEWTYVPDSPIEGGHYTPLFAKRRHLELCTWSRIVPFTEAFAAHYLDAAWTTISVDWLEQNGTTVQGFDLQQLLADQAAL
jgi:hypothetical protein